MTGRRSQGAGPRQAKRNYKKVAAFIIRMLKPEHVKEYLPVRGRACRRRGLNVE